MLALMALLTINLQIQPLQLKEELRFGGVDSGLETDQWLGSNTPCSFDIDQRGHIYVVDAKNVRILHFDDHGQLIDVLATRGQGPGEYQQISHFQIMKDGSAIGLESLQGTLRRQYYDQNIVFQRAETMTELVGFAPKVRFSPSGRFGYAWFIKFNAADQSLQSLSVITNDDLKPIEIINQTPWPVVNGTVLNDRNLMIAALALQFKGIWQLNARIAVYLSDDRLLFVNNQSNTIEIKSSDNKKTLMKINHTIKRQPFEEKQRQALVRSLEDHLFNQGGQALMNIVTPQVLRESIEKAELPKLDYPVQDVIPTPNGGFVLVTNINYETKGVSIHLFDKTGQNKGQTPFPGTGVWTLFGTRIKATDTHLYAMEVNQDGDNQMVKYRYN